MTTADPAFLNDVVDALAPLGTIERRPYFGGVGLVCNNRQFAFVMGTSLYLSTNDNTRESMRSHGAQPFEYMTKLGLRTVEAYYDTPAEILSHPELLLAWAQGALAAKSPASTKASKQQNGPINTFND